MKDDRYDDLFDDKEEKTDYRALLFKYIIRWPWFAGSVLLCLAGAWLYLQYSVPVYNITASVIIKDDAKGGTARSDLSAFEDMGILNPSKNIDNEIEILHSKSLIRNVVNELGLYIGYSAQSNFRNVGLYGDSPVLVRFSSQDADRLTEPLSLTLNLLPGGKLTVNATVNGHLSVRSFDKLPAVYPSEAGILTLLPGQGKASQEEEVIAVTIVRPLSVAKRYLRALTIEPTSKTTSIVTVSLKNTDKRRGEDFINKLIEMYNRGANNDKNEVAENTARFIDERIAVINRELGTTEEKLENFKRDAGLTDLSSDAQLAVTEKADYEKRCVENGTQLNLVEYLSKYLEQADNTAPLPDNVGLNDPSLGNLITRYNAVILERNRLFRSSSERNPVIKKLDITIHDMRANLSAAIASVRRGLLITKADLDRQSARFAGLISDAPTQERRFVSIRRQQEIKAGLYLMLLQKREENNITLAATANNAKIIDDALADDVPVFPKSKFIYAVALFIGIGIPTAVIYVLGLLSFRIEGRSDVEKLTTVPIIGDIPFTPEKTGRPHAIVVHENDNSVMAETFRNLRTGLLFMLGSLPPKKVILVTSTASGEGKTFIASNLAVSLSLLGKKVILLGLDIRKPGLNKVFEVSRKERGITQYLSDPQGTSLCSLIQPSGIIRNFDLLVGGTIPPNPAELLSGQALENLIATLRTKYDYIVMDTAPIGMVTDTQIIARVADISVYVCRADYTNKNEYRLINELQKKNRLPGLSTVINGLDMTKRKYGYYYGHGKYGEYYSYGYGRGSDYQEQQK